MKNWKQSAGVRGKKQAMKKTGKRGPRPLDQKADFDEPVKKHPTEPDQPTIEGLEAEEPPAPEQVENGMALMQFVRVKPSKDSAKRRFLEIELSVGLTDESAPLFGNAVEDRFAILRDDSGVTALSISDADSHTIDVCMTSGGEPVIHAIIEPQKMNLRAVQEKGSGKERTVIRLQFVAAIAQTDELALWACKTHGELVWVKMATRQSKLDF